MSLEKSETGSFWVLVIHHHSHFVGRPETSGHGSETLLYLRGLLLRQIVVDEDNRRKRDGLGIERDDWPLDIVFENAEVALGKVTHQLAVRIFHGDRDDDDVSSFQR